MTTSPIFVLIVTIAFLATIEATNPRKLTTTDTTTGGAIGDQSKCGGCPCNQPCYTAPPPPPPSTPPPKKPSPTPGLNCPPPPSYIYINGPPGNIYPVDPYAHSSSHRHAMVGLPLLVAVGLIGMLVFR